MSSTTYAKADEDLVRFVDNVMDAFHWRLRTAGVTVSVLVAEAPGTATRRARR